MNKTSGMYEQWIMARSTYLCAGFCPRVISVNTHITQAPNWWSSVWSCWRFPYFGELSHLLRWCKRCSNKTLGKHSISFHHGSYQGFSWLIGLLQSPYYLVSTSSPHPSTTQIWSCFSSKSSGLFLPGARASSQSDELFLVSVSIHYSEQLSNVLLDPRCPVQAGKQQLHKSGWPLVGNEGMKLYMVMMGIHSLIPY